MQVRSDAQLRDMASQKHKEVEMLENRLEVATKRFNLIIAHNAKLRAEIEALLKDRARFATLWNKLVGQLTTGKQIINDLIEQATIAFNQRDEELNKIQALRERYTRERNARCCSPSDNARKRSWKRAASGQVSRHSLPKKAEMIESLSP